MKRILGLVAILVVAGIIIAVPVFASGCSSDDAYASRMAQQSDGRGQGDLQRDGDRLMQGGGKGRGMFDRSDSRDCDGDCLGRDGCYGDCPGLGDRGCDGDCDQGTGIDCPGRGDRDRDRDRDCDGDCLEGTSVGETTTL